MMPDALPLYTDSVNSEEHIVATYDLRGEHLQEAAEALAVGQSIGNPDIRNLHETEELLSNHLAKILTDEETLQTQKRASVTVAYPVANYDPETDGVTQLMCSLMGGQMDVNSVEGCVLKDVELPPAYKNAFAGPRIGMEEIRERAKVTDRPLLGGIIKPKTGLTVDQLAEIVREMLKGGVDFIKEDEILGNPDICPFDERIERIADVLHEHNEETGREVFYAPCINSDYPHYIERVKRVEEVGLNACHINIWSGLPAYRAVRNLDVDLALFFQKSGDKVFTHESNDYYVDWPVVCQLAREIGADYIHAGMWGGYLSNTREELETLFEILTGDDSKPATVPSLSCGSHPGLVKTTMENFGTDLMMALGGAIHGHPDGTRAGARAMRQAMDCEIQGADVEEYMETHDEFRAAIEKWGLQEVDQ